LVIARGEVWWAALPSPAGPDPGFRRPVLIVQADSFNRSRIRTVMVVPLTSNELLAAAPGNVLLPSGETGLSKDSVANVSQVITIDGSLLDDRLDRIPERLLDEVDDGLRLALGL
jgi:mRNA interferase MazF